MQMSVSGLSVLVKTVHTGCGGREPPVSTSFKCRYGLALAPIQGLNKPLTSIGMPTNNVGRKESEEAFVMHTAICYQSFQDDTVIGILITRASRSLEALTVQVPHYWGCKAKSTIYIITVFGTRIPKPETYMSHALNS